MGSGGGTGSNGEGGRGGECYFSYDSIYIPREMGSGGGTGSNGEGGRGGGIIHMYISDELRVEGRLHSNGETGGGTTGGAGAGGSIYVVVGHLDGAGSIETFGGAGMEQLTRHY
ncbi:uncharacterized protein LOC143063055 [Mytilus galloprovincialis]|uniref:uncharacterized protein LOC143063055 n=1 Tax=Mytilus galloprovincialis TaxID=29158 RepID=UPI003F7C5707